MTREGSGTPEVEGYDPVREFTVLERFFFHRFAASVATELENSLVPGRIISPATSYRGLIAQINEMSRDPDTDAINVKGKAMLVRLFPRWLLRQYQWMFADPFPIFSAWMNAWVTKFATQWLMGESQVVDITMGDGSEGKQLGLKIEKCRFLEESGCVKTCIHACKVVHPRSTHFSPLTNLS